MEKNDFRRMQASSAGAKGLLEPSRANERTRTVDRIFEILELMDSEQRPLNMMEIADWLGYPVSSTAALLRSLVALGYLQHDRSSRRYAPTIRLAHLGAWAGPYLLPERCIAAMRDIHQRTAEVVFLAQQNDLRVQYLHIEAGDLADDFIPKVGTTRLLVRSGLGLALMSLLSDRAINSIIRRTNAILRDAEALDVNAVKEAVKGCRARGFVTTEHTLRLGRGMAAVPVIVGGRQLAVGVGAPVLRLQESVDFFVRAMKDMLLKHMASDIIIPGPVTR